MAGSVSSEERHLNRIAELLTSLSWMKGFPDTVAKFRQMVPFFAQFASTTPRTHFKLSPDQNIVPAEWLIDRIGKSFKFFPSPIEARALYCEYWEARDQLEIGDLTPDAPAEREG